MNKLIKLFLAKILFYIDNLVMKKEEYFSFSSYPDLTDNSYAMFKYIYKNSNKVSRFIWLLSDLSKIELYKKMIITDLSISEIELNKNIIFIKKNSILGLYWYMRSKYVFFTHGIYPNVKFPDTHVLINLWHGMPLKNIGMLDGKEITTHFSYGIATSKKYQSIMAEVFGVKEEKFLITGQPRCDLLFENKNVLKKLGVNKERYSKIIFWAPTYRQSIVSDIRQDGKATMGFPVVELSELEEFNAHLKGLNSFLIVKIHPMDILNTKKIKSYSNIMIVTNELLLTKSVQLYTLLGECDILMTDYSSIYIDYLLLNRPILFVSSDFQEYKNSRGFIFQNMEDLMPGNMIFTFNDLKSTLDELIVEELDTYQEKRRKVNDLFNEISKDFSSSFFNMLIKKNNFFAKSFSKKPR